MAENEAGAVPCHPEEIALREALIALIMEEHCKKVREYLEKHPLIQVPNG